MIETSIFSEVHVAVACRANSRTWRDNHLAISLKVFCVKKVSVTVSVEFPVS